MSDLFAVDLALNLRASIPSAELADLEWHLGHRVGILARTEAASTIAEVQSRNQTLR